MMSKADFWQRDQEEISQLNRERSALQEQIDTWQGLFRKTEDAALLAEMAIEEKDTSTLKEVTLDVGKPGGEYLESGTQVSSGENPMIGEMPLLPLMRGPGEPKPRTGWKCSSECMSGGLRPKG